MQFKNHPKNFCSAPWKATYYKESLQKYKMCCVFPTWTKADSPEDYYNSDVVKSVRESIMKGEWHPGCSTCKEQEEAGLHSDRESFNWNFDIEKNPVDTSKFDLKWIDYRPGNLCNLKCRMCSPSNSSLIQKEYHSYPEDILKVAQGRNEMYGDHQSTELLPSICNHETFKSLEVLKILGGEPTIDQSVFKLLDWVNENDYAKNIDLRYTTNATNINKRWIKATENFKTSRAQISLDGTGKTYEYIRTNANWNKVKENTLKIPTEIKNIKGMGTNIVFSLYNCFTIDEWYPEMLEIVDNINSRGVKYSLHIIDCTGPNYIRVRNLPDQFKDIIMDKLEKFPHDSTIQALKYFTTAKGSRDAKDMLPKFFKFNDHLDKIRKTNINDLSTIYEELRQTTIQ